MSPEQARGQRDLDEQTDVWALGVVLYEFERENTHATLAAVLTSPIPRLDEAAKGVPTALADVVARALERNRARRFESATELRAALVAANPSDAPVATVVPVATAVHVVPLATAVPVAAPPTRFLRPRRA